MTPAEIKARAAALMAAARSLFGELGGELAVTVHLHGIEEPAFDQMIAAAGPRADQGINTWTRDNAARPAYASVVLDPVWGTGIEPRFTLAGYMDIPGVAKPPPDYVPPVPPPAPVTVTPPAPSLPNLRDLDPNSDAAIRFSLLEMD